MPRMSIRATYSLDEQSDRRIKHLARTWRVSQAEVIRRSVQAAAEQSRDTLTAADVVAHYARGALPRTRQETRQVIRAMRRLRHVDDAQRAAKAP
ncbi:MAG: ribbon-helix-helix protein, CopG family [Rhodanobacteraceae bacterium]